MRVWFTGDFRQQSYDEIAQVTLDVAIQNVGLLCLQRTELSLASLRGQPLLIDC